MSLLWKSDKESVADLYEEYNSCNSDDSAYALEMGEEEMDDELGDGFKE